MKARKAISSHCKICGMIFASVYFKVQRHTRTCWFTVLPSLIGIEIKPLVFGDEAIITCNLRLVRAGLTSW